MFLVRARGWGLQQGPFPRPSGGCACSCWACDGGRVSFHCSTIDRARWATVLHPLLGSRLVPLSTRSDGRTVARSACVQASISSAPGRRRLCISYVATHSTVPPLAMKPPIPVKDIYLLQKLNPVYAYVCAFICWCKFGSQG
jgi:hypothetical protein